MRPTILVLALTLAAGCVSVGKTVLVPDLAPVPEMDVRIFMPGDSIPEHTRVAILNAEFNDDMSGDDDVLNKLRQEAGKLGANGVVLVGSEAEGAAARALRTLATGIYLGGRAKTEAYAILIR
jgi:hypothetical protein